MTSLSTERRGVNTTQIFAESIAQVKTEMQKQLEREVERKLDESITQMLQRVPYGRRSEVPNWVEIEGKCQRCGSRKSQRFSRNGGRTRGLLTLWGWLDIWGQRLLCECGGSVCLEYEGWLRPYQRIGEDVDKQVQRWGGLCLSLRQMQKELEHMFISPLAQRTLNQRLHQLEATVSDAAEMSVPPILQIDAIWVTQLTPTGTFHRDRKGRLRPDKSRSKRPIFIALGVWLDSDRAEILAWHLGDGEDEAGWVQFLEQLEALGVRGENGLELIIHDGGSGLCAALRTVFFNAEQQRCLLHKLRNIYNAIHIQDEQLSHNQRRRLKKRIFKDFHAIYQAKRWDTMLRRYIKACRQYRLTQPDAVQTLRRDFRHTITYLFIQCSHPDWQLRHLRTTSRLERFNRCIRRRARAASAYHSDAGINAMMNQEILAFNASHAHI